MAVDRWNEKWVVFLDVGEAQKQLDQSFRVTFNIYPRKNISENISSCFSSFILTVYFAKRAPPKKWHDFNQRLLTAACLDEDGENVPLFLFFFTNIYLHANCYRCVLLYMQPLFVFIGETL